MKNFLEHRITSFDLRSIGLFRIALEFALIYNLVFYRFPAVGVYYNNNDWLPESSASDYYGISFPLFRWLEMDWWYYLLLVVMLILSLLFLIGYKTKWITPLLFVMFGSLITTNPYLAHGVEYLEETALFWCMFLPMSHRFTLFKDGDAGFMNFGKLAQFGFQFQLFLIYFSSWIFKNGELWRDGKILEIVSKDLIHARSLLQWLGDYSMMSEVSTYLGFYLEVFVSVFLLISFFSEKAKLCAAIGILLMHSVMAVLLHVGTFFLVGLAFGLLLLPESFWNWSCIKNKLKLSLNEKSLSIPPRWEKAKTIFIIGTMFFILQGNLHHWSKNSYLSPVLSKVPLYNYTIGRQLPDPGIFTGFWHQSWKFFPNNIHADLGDFLYVGYDDNGTPYELRTGEKLNITNYNGLYKMDPLPSTSYFGAEFTFGVYYKFYQDRFPVATQKGWLELQLDKYKDRNPSKSISKAELWKLQRFYSYKNENLILRDTLFKLVTIDKP